MLSDGLLKSSWGDYRGVHVTTHVTSISRVDTLESAIFRFRRHGKVDRHEHREDTPVGEISYNLLVAEVEFLRAGSETILSYCNADTTKSYNGSFPIDCWLGCNLTSLRYTGRLMSGPTSMGFPFAELYCPRPHARSRGIRLLQCPNALVITFVLHFLDPLV